MSCVDSTLIMNSFLILSNVSIYSSLFRKSMNVKEIIKLYLIEFPQLGNVLHDLVEKD